LHYRIATYFCLAAATGLAAASRAGAQSLDASTLTKFVDPLPRLADNLITPTGDRDGAPLYDVTISQFQQQLHSELPPTTLWGYNGSFPGPMFDVPRDQAIHVRWTNNLVDDSGQPLPHFLPYDPTLHGAAPVGHAGHGAPYPQARTVTHLHGGVTNEQSDGYPEHWFSADPSAPANGLGGPAGNSLVTTYDNPQRAATLWYHDHAMAATRLNVYAGMAGVYLIRDAEEAALGLPSGDYEIPLLIQDRSFNADGSLYYPGGPGHLPNQPGTVTSLVLGDANLVNGMVWPYLEVEPRKYRFRLVNGANGRFYNLSLVPDAGAAALDPVTMHQIGTDGGLLSGRVPRQSVALAPADRADLVVDFSQYNVGDTLRLWNDDLNANEGTTDQVMQFRIGSLKAPDASILPDSLSTIERYREQDVTRVRTLQLTRGIDESGRARLLLDGKRWTDEITETVRQGDLELWEITNTTGSDHPIHLHLEAFQVLRRRSVSGGEIPLEDFDRGWEDTFAVPNGQTVQFLVKFSTYTGTFVWHCHILEHEDHEMMRPMRIVMDVVPEPAAWTLVLAATGAIAHVRRRKEGSRWREQ
jgi:spore coat protein A